MEEWPLAERGELGSRVQIQLLGLSYLSQVLQWKNGRTEVDCDLGQSWGSLVSLSTLVCPGPAGDMHLEGVSCVFFSALLFADWIECIPSHWLFIWLVSMSISRLLLGRVMRSCKEKFCGYFINVFLASSPLCGGPSFLSSIFLWVDCLQHL